MLSNFPRLFNGENSQPILKIFSYLLSDSLRPLIVCCTQTSKGRVASREFFSFSHNDQIFSLVSPLVDECRSCLGYVKERIRMASQYLRIRLSFFVEN